MAIRFDRIELSDDGNHLYPYIEGKDGYLTIRTTSGELQIGPGNTTYSHFYTDRGNFYFNRATAFDGSVSAYGGDENLTNWNNVDGAQFRDKSNTAFYLDPASNNTSLNVAGAAHWDLEAGQYSGDPRAVVMGYSGGNYGQIGYNIAFTTTSGSHTRVFNDIPTRIDLHNGIVVYASSGGAAGTSISWTEVLEAQTDAFQYKGQDIYHTGNNTSILNSNVTLASLGAAPSSTTTTANNALPKSGGTMTGDIDLGSGAASIKKTANTSGNYPAIEVYSSGTDDSGAAIAIQQATSEGDTIIFADYEPHVEWGISAENNANEIHFTAGSATGSLGTKTFKNNAGSNRTAYKKVVVNLSSGVMTVGGDVRAPIFYDYNDTNYYVNPGDSTTSLYANGKLYVNGGHTSGRIQINYQHGSNPSTDSNSTTLTAWASEPGITYNGAGIGANIHVNGQYYGRAYDTGYGVYTRFDKANGRLEHWTTQGNAGTSGGQGTRQWYNDASGNSFATTSSRAPIFRDSNNSNYYADLASSSIALNINGIIDQNFEQSNLNTAWTTPGSNFAEGFIVGRYQASASNIPSNNDNANWFMNIYSHSSGGTASYGIQLAGSNAGSGENALSLRNVSNGSFSAWRKVYHEGHKPTYSELGSMAYSNLTGTPTIPTDFVSAANGGTFSGNIVIGGNSAAAPKLFFNKAASGTAEIKFNNVGSEKASIELDSAEDLHIFANTSQKIKLRSGGADTLTLETNQNATFAQDIIAKKFIDSNDTTRFLNPSGQSLLGAVTFRQGASDQNNTADTGSIPSTTGAEMLRLEGNYTNGQYTHELAKIDRGGNLPLYIRESKSTANSFTNLVRFGNHSNSQKEFQVFGDAQAYSYYSTGTVTGTAFYDTDNSGRYVDPGSTGDSTFLRGYVRSTKYKRFANTFDSEYPSAMPMIGGSDSSIGRGYGTVGFDTNGRLAIYERIYTIKISGSGWLNRNTNPIPIFPPSGNHFVVVEDFVVYIDYETRTGISNNGIARLNDTNAYTVGFFENAQSGNSPGSGQFFTLGVMPQNFVRNATTDQGYYRDVPVHQSKLLPNRGLFLRTARDCTTTSNAPGGTHYIQIKYRIINTSSEMESEVDYNVNYAGTTSNRVTPLHDVDGSFISY